jgi:hypothetical protein
MSILNPEQGGVLGNVLPSTSFGEVKVAEPTPMVQISSQYGLTDELIHFSAATGNASIENNLFNVNTGTDPFGLGTITSNEHLHYRAGQGCLAKFSSLFTNGTTSGIQLAGLINSENSFGFGYLDGDFGILISKGGVVEQYSLEITSSAILAEDATITIDDTSYIVPLTSGTPEQNAQQIVASLKSQTSLFLFSANNSTVTIMALVPEPKGAFSFSSGTATANFTKLVSGVQATFTCIPQSDWNGNIVPWLDPEKGNIYSISFKYLGFGNTKFYVENQKTGMDILVHTIEYTNKNITTNVNTPEFRLGWLVSNRGTNTTDVVVRGASAAGFIEGKDLNKTPFISYEGVGLGIGTNPVNLLTVRNRFEFNLKANRTDILPLLLSAGTDSSKNIIFKLTINPDFQVEPNFSYIEKDNFISEISTDNVLIVPNTGRQIASFIVNASSPLVLDLTPWNLKVSPNEILVLSSQIISGGVQDMSASLSWTENL